MRDGNLKARQRRHKKVVEGTVGTCGLFKDEDLGRMLQPKAGFSHTCTFDTDFGKLSLDVYGMFNSGVELSIDEFIGTQSSAHLCQHHMHEENAHAGKA